MKYVIYNTIMKQVNPNRCYLGDDLNENWISLVSKENARKFEKEQDAFAFLKERKLKKKEHALEECE